MGEPTKPLFMQGPSKQAWENLPGPSKPASSWKPFVGSFQNLVFSLSFVIVLHKIKGANFTWKRLSIEIII